MQSRIRTGSMPAAWMKLADAGLPGRLALRAPEAAVA